MTHCHTHLLYLTENSVTKAECDKAMSPKNTLARTLFNILQKRLKGMA